MYAPLKFMEQIEYLFDGADSLDERAVDFCTKLFANEDFRHVFINDFAHSFTKFNSYIDRFEQLGGLERYRYTREGFIQALGLSGYNKISFEETISDYDFFTFLMQYFIHDDWRYHKLTYKVSDYLGKRLIDMPSPDKALSSCFTKLPATTFCIDLSDVEQNLCEDLSCIFISSASLKDDESGIGLFSMVETVLAQSKNGRLLPMFTASHVRYSLNNDDELSFREVGGIKPKKVTFEDGETRTVDIKGIQNFISNFLIYLSAANRDIEMHEACRSNFNKPVDRTKKVKNKFGEMRIQNVGYKYSSVLPKKKYVYNDDMESDGKKGSPKSAHYRSAHWHHFWTGSGDKKELIVKWVDGVFVNGKAEADTAVLHTVKEKK